MQGNLDPLRLVAGGEALDEGVDAILRALGDGPLIFNLGHGITPETPVAHVEADGCAGAQERGAMSADATQRQAAHAAMMPRCDRARGLR